jgi:hypothetical protein
MRRALLITLLITFISGGGGAQPTSVDRILLPLAIEPTSGAYGSRWVTELWVRNNSAQTIPLWPVRVTDVDTLPAKTTSSPPIFLSPPGLIPGTVLKVPAGQSAQLSFNLRVRDISRQAENWGTEIPVVRETELSTSTIQLLNIPVEGRFRQTLRIYALTTRDGAAPTVRVRVYPLQDEGKLVELDLPLRVEQPVELAFAQVSAFRETFQLPASITNIRVEIEPLTLGLRFWAFVSVTNNDTQHVTTITPQ